MALSVEDHPCYATACAMYTKYLLLDGPDGGATLTWKDVIESIERVVAARNERLSTNPSNQGENASETLASN